MTHSAQLTIALYAAGYAADLQLEVHSDNPNPFILAEPINNHRNEIPEPGAAVLGLVGALLLLRRRR